MGRMIIRRNSARCDICMDEIESKTRHDFVTCKCKNLSVDGGKDYLRRVFRERKWTDTSIEKDVEGE